MKETKQVILDGVLGKIEESSLVIFLTQKKDSRKEVGEQEWKSEKVQHVLFDEDTSFKELCIDLKNKHNPDSPEQSICKSDFKIEDAVSVVVRRKNDKENLLVADSVRRIVLK